jgi:hypothetical protein
MRLRKVVFGNLRLLGVSCELRRNPIFTSYKTIDCARILALPEAFGRLDAAFFRQCPEANCLPIHWPTDSIRGKSRFLSRKKP